MALWGNKDDKTSTGTVAVAANGLVSGTSTKIDTEAKEGDYLRANGVDYIIKSITSNTVAHVAAGTLGAAIAVTNAGNNITYSEKPKSVSTSEVGGDPLKVFGVDTTEVGITDTTHAGWVRRTTGSGGRSGRVQYEVLVAGSTISSDAADDSVLADFRIVISTQPLANTANGSVSNAPATFRVVSVSEPAGATLGYAWTYANGDAIATNANVGVTTGATLVVNTATQTANADFKVTITNAQSDTLVSGNATLTVTS